jgi:hypothetical protein
MSETVNFLLAQIAFQIQLSPTKWETASQRYETIAEYLQSDGSLLCDRVRDNYPQGSVRIQSAISSAGREDQHDIDFITELASFPGRPDMTIDHLFRSLDRGPGSRYYGMCERRNRCVTVHYSDMHLDVTPAVRENGLSYRSSRIPDRRLDQEVIANPEGFAQWFEEMLQRLPGELVEVHKTEPVNDQEPVGQKPVPLIGLQLNKRWRSMRYQGREGRKPPSVVLAKLTIDNALAARRPRGLLDELTLQCSGMQNAIGRLHREGRLLRIVNPRCERDLLTDRWPSTLEAQQLFLDDLRCYAEDLTVLRSEASMETEADVAEASVRRGRHRTGLRGSCGADAAGKRGWPPQARARQRHRGCAGDR